MNQRDLNHAVARATGESDATIAALGFSLVDMTPPAFDLRRQLRRTAPRRLAASATHKTTRLHGRKVVAGVGQVKSGKTRAKILRLPFDAARANNKTTLRLAPSPLKLDLDRPEGA